MAKTDASLFLYFWNWKNRVLISHDQKLENKTDLSQSLWNNFPLLIIRNRNGYLESASDTVDIANGRLSFVSSSAVIRFDVIWITICNMNFGIIDGIRTKIYPG